MHANSPFDHYLSHQSQAHRQNVRPSKTSCLSSKTPSLFHYGSVGNGTNSDLLDLHSGSRSLCIARRPYLRHHIIDAVDPDFFF